MNMYSDCNQASSIALHCLNVLANSNIIIPKAAGWKHSSICAYVEMKTQICISLSNFLAWLYARRSLHHYHHLFTLLSPNDWSRDKSVSFHCCHHPGYTSLRGEIICDIYCTSEKKHSVPWALLWAHRCLFRESQNTANRIVMARSENAIQSALNAFEN